MRTPNIQRLAEEGVLFREAFCAAPTCSVSRACLLTGQYAHSNGMVGLAHRGFSLKDYRHHIVHTLRANEAQNLAGSPAHADTLEELRGKLAAWMVETKDPLLEGDVPAPEDAELNDPDGLSPAEPTIVV